AMSDERLRFCTDAIEGWDDGYNTEIGSEGAKLSGGERQKIALLRALHRKADVLVLDEPTSNYDKESEDGFDDFIRTDDRYRFCFVITHRDGVVVHMDKVVSLDGVKVECN
ncbi:MAG: ATP-binding cassette domain-containing protein, partial [Oscillospiraceae bacterium]|nr:ATP-binding cassette domain-containing protein [Oscillospiraceae bacterium]